MVIGFKCSSRSRWLPNQAARSSGSRRKVAGIASVVGGGRERRVALKPRSKAVLLTTSSPWRGGLSDTCRPSPPQPPRLGRCPTTIHSNRHRNFSSIPLHLSRKTTVYIRDVKRETAEYCGSRECFHDDDRMQLLPWISPVQPRSARRWDKWLKLVCRGSA